MPDVIGVGIDKVLTGPGIEGPVVVPSCRLRRIQRIALVDNINHKGCVNAMRNCPNESFHFEGKVAGLFEG